MQSEASGASLSDDMDANDRQRLYDVIIRFRLRPIRRPVGRPGSGSYAQSLAQMPDAARRALSGDDALDRVGRGVIVIDAIGRVLFVNRTAEWMLEQAVAVEVTQGGFLRLAARNLQARFARFLVDSRAADRHQVEATGRSESLQLRLEPAAGVDASHLVVTPLFDPPLARLVQRTGPLHAVFVYEAPPRVALP